MFHKDLLMSAHDITFVHIDEQYTISSIQRRHLWWIHRSVRIAVHWNTPPIALIMHCILVSGCLSTLLCLRCLERTLTPEQNGCHLQNDSFDFVFPDRAHLHFDGLMQEWRNSIANALKLRLSCINPAICSKGRNLPPVVTSSWNGLAPHRWNSHNLKQWIT